MKSYWGVEHGEEISKFENKKSSDSRKLFTVGTNALLGSPGAGIHGAVAGKKGKKLRAAGNQFGASALGGAGGGAAGGLTAGLLTRGRSQAAASTGGVVGGFLGSSFGALGGLARNERKGYLKKG